MASINDGLNKDNKIVSVLMIGQSNMAGRGNLGEVPEIKNPRCFMLRMGRWQAMRDPINTDRPISGIRYPSGVSLAGSFMDGLAEFLDREVGVIPCADGGTALSQWMPGEIIYDHAVMMCGLAKRTSDIGAIIWHQGESDSETDPIEYKKNLKIFFTELRAALGDPELPIIAGELAHTITPNWYCSRTWPTINRILHELEDELPAFAVAPADGLELKEDGIHFNSVSLREFGKRYLEKYIYLYNKAH
ncbi:MAG: sialate O-acetylesterase [Clostridia bacterium]|nr:sialate O-acetylesterase [Clostridia bacterium]